MVLEINETRIVIGTCHRVLTDVKEAGRRVRSQLTVGRFWSIRLSVRIRDFHSLERGSTPLCSTINGPLAQLVRASDS